MADSTMYLQFIIVLFAILNGGNHGNVQALRFKNPAIKMSSDILMVGKEAKLTCNYLKAFSEDIREIIWYAGYGGTSIKILQYQIGGTARGSTYSWIQVDEDTATEKELTIKLTEMREKKMKFKCEVKARSELPGNLRLNRKSGETEFDVADTNSHQLMLKTGRPTASLRGMGNERTATIGDQLIVSCMSLGATLTPNLTLHVNNQKFETFRGGRVNVESFRERSRNVQGTALVGYIDNVVESMFQYGSNKLLVECKAWYGDQIFGKKTLELTKKDSGRRVIYDRNHPQHQEPRHNRQFQGNSRPERVQGFERHAEQVHSHLLQMMDPARHMHPGIPYDFYSGYIVVEGKNFDEQDGNSRYVNAVEEKTVVLGQLPQTVKQALQKQYGKYQQVNDNKVIMKLNAVTVLNLLGNLDYRIIGTSSPDKKQVIWTLEHKDFQKLKDLPNNDIDHFDHGFN